MTLLRNDFTTFAAFTGAGISPILRFEVHTSVTNASTSPAGIAPRMEPLPVGMPCEEFPRTSIVITSRAGYQHLVKMQPMLSAGLRMTGYELP
jgi:hypothetical protein